MASAFCKPLTSWDTAFYTCEGSTIKPLILSFNIFLLLPNVGWKVFFSFKFPCFVTFIGAIHPESGNISGILT